MTGGCVAEQLQARNCRGESGLVPESYIQILDPSADMSAMPSGVPAAVAAPMAASECYDYTNVTVNASVHNENSDPHPTALYSATDYEVQAALTSQTLLTGEGFSEEIRIF